MTLLCNINSNPYSKEFYWRKNGKELPLNTSQIDEPAGIATDMLTFQCASKNEPINKTLSQIKDIQINGE